MIVPAYLQEAILSYLENIEDRCLAEQRLSDIHAGRTRPIPIEAVIKKHGVSDGA